ncbi:MAG: DnaJ domain-containing protein [Acidobacteriota bacterium]
MQQDFYAILSIPRDATTNQIKARFRALAREKHPDRFSREEKPDAERAFQAITEAFNVLSDPNRRRQHDLTLAHVEHQASAPQESEAERLLRVYLTRGIKAYNSGNTIDAADNFRRATQSNPKSAKAWHHLAMTCLQQERWWPQAREAILKALELEAENVVYLKLAGRIFAQSGLAPRARQYYNRALRLAGPNESASIRRALEDLGAPSGGKSEPAKEKASLFRKLF